MQNQDFYNKVELQKETNLAKHGRQDLRTLSLVCQEELGEVTHELLANDMVKLRIEIVHLAALLPVLYEATLIGKG